jgi:UDP-N-acetylglucosamine transferase subunit ALG13
LDEISKTIDDDMIMQIGNGNYFPKNVDYFKFIEENEYIKYIKKCNLVISHAGIGSIITALTYNKPLIIIPRRKKFGEHIDDHQIEIAKNLENDPRVKVIYDVDLLDKELHNFKIHDIRLENSRDKLIKKLTLYIQNL